jgi:hypothetical protein
LCKKKCATRDWGKVPRQAEAFSETRRYPLEERASGVAADNPDIETGGKLHHPKTSFAETTGKHPREAILR